MMASSTAPTVLGCFAMRGNVDQLQSVTALLEEKPGSRRAVVQLFNAEDITSEHKEIPCTTTPNSICVRNSFICP